MSRAWSFVGYFFLVAFCFLLVVSVFRVANGGYALTFQSFLDSIQNMPSITDFVANLDLTITADWGIFNFLRDFINVLGTLTTSAMYITGLLMQVIVSIGWVIGWAFGIA